MRLGVFVSNGGHFMLPQAMTLARVLVTYSGSTTLNLDAAAGPVVLQTATGVGTSDVAVAVDLGLRIEADRSIYLTGAGSSAFLIFD